MNLYIDGDDIYYAPSGGNATLVTEGGDYYAVPGAADHAPTSRIDMARSVDAGVSWETVATNLPAAPDGVSLDDYECLSSGDTQYRAVAYTALEAEAETQEAVTAASPAFWLSTGETFETTARLPWQVDNPPRFDITSKRARSSEYYEGRPYPVAYSGGQISRDVYLDGILIHDETENATRKAFEQVALSPHPVHLLRSPEGDRIYGILTDTPLSHSSPIGWGFQVSMTETERG